MTISPDRVRSTRERNPVLISLSVRAKPAPLKPPNVTERPGSRSTHNNPSRTGSVSVQSKVEINRVSRIIPGYRRAPDPPAVPLLNRILLNFLARGELLPLRLLSSLCSC